MVNDETYFIPNLLQKISSSGLKLTKPRKKIVDFLFKGKNKHVSAETLHYYLTQQNIKISLATIYNTLNSLSRIGLLKEIKLSSTSFFDTLVSSHAHIFNTKNGKIEDINIDILYIENLKKEIPDHDVIDVDIIFRVSK